MRYLGIQIVLAALVAGAAAWPLEQKPLTDTIEEVKFEVDAPGIGFDLSTSYGTAAIKYRNGTVIDVGKIQGNWEYKHLMRRLSEKGWPFSPPFDNRFDEMKWSSQQLERRLRKLQGLPATEEIGILSSMISTLQYITQDKLSTPVTQVAVTLPHLPMLLSSDLIEAFEYAGMQRLSKNIYGELDEAIAAHVGMGYGLCSNPDNHNECREEESRMPNKQTVAISFSNSSLVVRNIIIYNGHLFASGISEEKNYLGFSNIYELPDFWDRVGAEIRATAGIFGSNIKVEELLLYGEAAEEKKFLDEVWKVLGHLQDHGKLQSTAAGTYAEITQRASFNATYISARGAAEFARRWQGVRGGSMDGAEV